MTKSSVFWGTLFALGFSAPAQADHIVLDWNSVEIGFFENIDNYICRVRVYIFGYLLGHQAGVKLEELVKKFSKEYKSYRHIAENQ